ncbi:MAG TPA: LysR family transcriptional regulator [Steroidobacteraceae bacterium]|nr:LysR family transcriptional regulator [Steroidobacteraceae bacterium]
MPRRTPSLQSVDSFVVAARLRSFRAAADQLAISVAAFSRRIQQLENAVGVALFERSSCGVRVTAEGERYLAQIEQPMTAIRCATLSLQNSNFDGGAAIRVATSRSFASNWLLPRLTLIHDALGLQLQVRIARNLELLRSGEIDMAIWGGLGPVGRSEELFAAEAVPVAAAHRSMPLQSVGQIAEQRLLGVLEPERLWERWFDATGHGAHALRATDFETLRLMYESAAAGLGITLAIPVIAEPYLQAGMLRACATSRSPLGTGYRIYFASAATARRAAVLRLRDWLRKEISRSQQRFDTWWAAQLTEG